MYRAGDEAGREVEGTGDVARSNYKVAKGFGILMIRPES